MDLFDFDAAMVTASPSEDDQSDEDQRSESPDAKPRRATSSKTSKKRTPASRTESKPKKKAKKAHEEDRSSRATRSTTLSYPDWGRTPARNSARRISSLGLAVDCLSQSISLLACVLS